MPVCQGRPNAKCPYSANDDTVRFTQGDLFLCHDCEEFRFPSSSSAKSGRGKAAKKPAQAGARSKTLPHSSEDVTSKLDQPEQPKVICHAATCIVSDKPAAISCDTCHGLFHCECIGLDSQMLHQFCSLAHVLGWVCMPCRDIVRSQLNLLQSQQTDLACTVEKLKEDVAKLQRDIVSGQLPLTTENLSNSNTWPSLHSSKEQKKQLLAVVHADMEDSKRRRCNIIVSGLKPKSGVSDVDLFLDVCERNLTLKPHVTRNKCRRLGRQQLGKIQPLLICLTNADTANDLLAVAKQLRQSDDADIRDQVYFNPDLTPGEAQAAYERRQRRRQRMGQQRAPAAIVDTAADQPSVATSLQHLRTGSQIGRYQAANYVGLPADSNQHVTPSETDDTANDDSRVHNIRSPQLNINAVPFKFDERVPSLS